LSCIGCGVADEKTPRAGSGAVLREMLQQNHRFVFSLIHKFNQEVKEHISQADRDKLKQASRSWRRCVSC
jgi:type I restriction enzyme R subunit